MNQQDANSTSAWRTARLFTAAVLFTLLLLWLVGAL